jgi:hypothetical protein
LGGEGRVKGLVVYTRDAIRVTTNWAKKEDGFANDQRFMAYHSAFHLIRVEC